MQTAWESLWISSSTFLQAHICFIVSTLSSGHHFVRIILLLWCSMWMQVDYKTSCEMELSGTVVTVSWKAAFQM